MMEKGNCYSIIVLYRDYILESTVFAVLGYALPNSRQSGLSY